jgi:hypothetical protein
MSSVPMKPFVRFVTVVQERVDNAPPPVVYWIVRFLLLLPPPPYASFQRRSRLTALLAKPIARCEGLAVLFGFVVHVNVLMLPSTAFGGRSFKVRPLGKPATELIGIWVDEAPAGPAAGTVTTVAKAANSPEATAILSRLRWPRSPPRPLPRLPVHPILVVIPASLCRSRPSQGAVSRTQAGVS